MYNNVQRLGGDYRRTCVFVFFSRLSFLFYLFSFIFSLLSFLFYLFSFIFNYRELELLVGPGT
jgi:hypothetical protein